MKRRLGNIEAHPINRVEWRHRDELHANDYNPNRVAPVELSLLKESIKLCGWTQPIVIRSNGEIVDGFHRWTVSGHAEIYELTDGMVPVVVMADQATRAEQMAATVTHNRARGTHHVLRMADIVRDLKDNQGKDDAWIAKHLGMDEEEIERLYDATPSPQRKRGADFNDGWIPDRSGVGG